jgi:stress-induced morphogen
MSRRIREGMKPDSALNKILTVLGEYEKDHPNAEIEVYRQNSVSIRIRIIDPEFEGKDRVDRDEEIWKILKQLPEKIRLDITILLLLTPEEAKHSFANMDFEDPIPSKL